MLTSRPLLTEGHAPYYQNPNFWTLRLPYIAEFGKVQSSSTKISKAQQNWANQRPVGIKFYVKNAGLTIHTLPNMFTEQCYYIRNLTPKLENQDVYVITLCEFGQYNPFLSLCLPPQGVLLYGPPGTGKTLLARAVAHHTECTFIRVSGSELVQKFIGEGSRMVRELFVMAR